MAKPILLIYLTQDNLEMEAVQNFQKYCDNKFIDYYALVVPAQRRESIEVEVHNSKNINYIQFKELKTKVSDALEKFNKSK